MEEQLCVQDFKPCQITKTTHLRGRAMPFTRLMSSDFLGYSHHQRFSEDKWEKR